MAQTSHSTQEQTRSRLEGLLEGARDSLRSGKMDEMRGRLKEALGALSDDPEMRSEGRAERAVGKSKQKAEHAIDEAKEALKR